MVNAMGQTVWSERLSPGRQILDVSDLPNGMHLLIYEDRTQRVLIRIDSLGMKKPCTSVQGSCSKTVRNQNP